jgi:hypothetical protein
MKGSGRFAVLLILAAAPLLQARGARDSSAGGEGQVPGFYENARTGALVEVTGLVRLVGSEPFPELVITGRDNQVWYIAQEDRAVLRKFEQQTVTVRGVVRREERMLANGKRLEDRLVLSAVVVVE